MKAFQICLAVLFTAFTQVWSATPASKRRGDIGGSSSQRAIFEKVRRENAIKEETSKRQAMSPQQLYLRYLNYIYAFEDKVMHRDFTVIRGDVVQVLDAGRILIRVEGTSNMAVMQGVQPVNGEVFHDGMNIGSTAVAKMGVFEYITVIGGKATVPLYRLVHLMTVDDVPSAVAAGYDMLTLANKIAPITGD